MVLRYTPEAVLASFPDTPILPLLPENTTKSKPSKAIKPATDADTTDHYPYHRNDLLSILKYIDKMAEGIEGDGGSVTTYNTALKLISTFGLSVEETIALLLKHWNYRCKPEWTLAELMKKVQDAADFYAKMNRNRPFVTGFRWNEKGLHKVIVRGRGDNAEIVNIWVSAPFTVIGRASDDQGQNPHLIIELTNDKGVTVRVVIPCGLLANPAEIYRRLSEKGLVIASDGAPATVKYLSEAQRQVPTTCKLVYQCGWHGDNFMAPDGTVYSPEIEVKA